MRHLTLRRSTHIAAIAAMLTGAGAAPAITMEEGSHTVTISRDLLSSAPSPEGSTEISALTLESDFTVFMREGVPEDVQLAALRRLWVLMAPPVSCHELCADEGPTGSSAMRVASEKPPVSTQ